jgi:hypothetical protein
MDSVSGRDDDVVILSRVSTVWKIESLNTGKDDGNFITEEDGIVVNLRFVLKGNLDRVIEKAFEWMKCSEIYNIKIMERSVMVNVF